nr:hypothetical protein [Halomarina sp. BND7]
MEGPLRLVNLLEKRGYDVDGKTVELELEPYGVRWFRVGDVQASEKGATPRSDG